MVTSRKIDDLEQTAAAIRAETGGAVATFAANAGEPDQADACVAATIERFGTLDILVNNAATNPYFGPTIEIDPGRFDKTAAVNWRGPLMWSQSAWRASMAERGGVILNIASVGGMAVEPSIGVYNGTKAAVIHLTRQLALELSPGVRVNGIAPGLVKTDMARALWEPNEESMARHTPVGRLGEPEDIANAAVFLCSDAASWITGTTLVVDGGALLRA
jgi:NAD(P)-dependent dehydrogenase (short-subunit alcohol dehydrogenase family)